MKKELPEVGGKSPWAIFIYWGYMGINGKPYSGGLCMYILKRSWREIYLKPEARVMAIYN